jgi:hypothetical protein
MWHSEHKAGYVNQTKATPQLHQRYSGLGTSHSMKSCNKLWNLRHTYRRIKARHIFSQLKKVCSLFHRRSDLTVVLSCKRRQGFDTLHVTNTSTRVSSLFMLLQVWTRRRGSYSVALVIAINNPCVIGCFTASAYSERTWHIECHVLHVTQFSVVCGLFSHKPIVKREKKKWLNCLLV